MAFLDPAVDPARPALLDAASGERWSHGRLRQAVAGVAEALGPGRALCFCYCDLSVPSVLGYLAALETGHAVVLLDASLDAERRADLAGRYRPEVVLAPEGARHEAAPGYLAPGAVAPGLSAWRRAGAGPAQDLHPALRLLLSTSGSTGSPKLVRLSLGSVVANADAIRQSLGLTAEERALTSLPFHYSYGLSVLNSHLRAGAALVVTAASVVEAGFWSAAAAHGATSFAGVPYTYELLARVGLERRAPPSLRVLTQAGGKLKPELAGRFHRFMADRGGRFFVMYGQTEATARMACLPSEDLPRKLGSAGRAIPGGRFTIEADGCPLPPGQVGEVVYRGPNVMMGYASSREDLARGDELGGVLPTGDLGTLDDEGFLLLTGRAKRIAKVFGLRLNLDELEAELHAGGPVAAVQQGERVVAFCEYGTTEELVALGAALARRLRLHPSGLELRRVAALPLTPNGKIDYQSLAGAP